MDDIDNYTKDGIPNFYLENKGNSSDEYIKNRIRNDEVEKTPLKELKDRKENKTPISKTIKTPISKTIKTPISKTIETPMFSKNDNQKKTKGQNIPNNIRTKDKSSNFNV